MKEIFKQPYLECFYDEDANVMFHAWIRKPSSDELKTGLTRVCNEYMNLRKARGSNIHWLGDTRKFGVVSVDDQGWLEKVWNEMLFVKANVRTHAVVIGNDVFVKYAMEKWKNSMMEKHKDTNLHMATFPEKDEAYRWFKECEKVVS
jgi:hypothetical protein